MPRWWTDEMRTTEWEISQESRYMSSTHRPRWDLVRLQHSKQLRIKSISDFMLTISKNKKNNLCFNYNLRCKFLELLFIHLNRGIGNSNSVTRWFLQWIESTKEGKKKEWRDDRVLFILICYTMNNVAHTIKFWLMFLLVMTIKYIFYWFFPVVFLFYFITFNSAVIWSTIDCGSTVSNRKIKLIFGGSKGDHEGCTPPHQNPGVQILLISCFSQENLAKLCVPPGGSTPTSRKYPGLATIYYNSGNKGILYITFLFLFLGIYSKITKKLSDKNTRKLSSTIYYPVISCCKKKTLKH